MILNTSESVWTLSFQKNIKIFLTGGHGFIGSNILNRLQEKYEFVAPSKNLLDLTNPTEVNEYLKDQYFDFVIHCAIVGGRRNGPDTKKIFDKNFDMFENLLNNQDHFGKLINIGSGADTLNTWYGKSKKVIGNIIRGHDNMVNLRCFGVWGEGEEPDRFPTYCVTHKQVTIKEDKLMRYIHVAKLVKIIDDILNNWPKMSEYTLGEPIKLSDFAKQLNPTIKVIVKDTGTDYI